MMTRGTPSYKFQPVGRCIYCGTDAAKLTDEHIIARALGGNLILPEASCDDCAIETKRIEQICARRMFGAYRIRTRMPTRRPKERPEYLPLDIIDADSNDDTIQVATRDHPSILAMLVWGPPRLLISDRTEEVKGGVSIYFPDATTGSMLLRPSVTGLRVNFADIRAFARMLAKIAYGLAIAKRYMKVDPDLDVVRCIMNKDYDYLAFIGGDVSHQTKVDGVLHRVRFTKPVVGGVMYLVAEIRLFAHLGMPMYTVVLASRPV